MSAFLGIQGLIAGLVDSEQVHTSCLSKLHHTCRTPTPLLESEGLTNAERTGTPAPTSVWATLDKWTVDEGVLSTTLQRYTKPCWLEADVHQSDKLFEELYLEAEMRLMAAFACMAHRKCGKPA